jgi:hypothetical protein
MSQYAPSLACRVLNSRPPLEAETDLRSSHRNRKTGVRKPLVAEVPIILARGHLKAELHHASNCLGPVNGTLIEKWHASNGGGPSHFAADFITC